MSRMNLTPITTLKDTKGEEIPIYRGTNVYVICPDCEGSMGWKFEKLAKPIQDVEAPYLCGCGGEFLVDGNITIYPQWDEIAGINYVEICRF